MTRIACIDIGTVTCRLAVADVYIAQARSLNKRSTICNLGEGLAATGRIAPAARERVLTCVGGYLAAARRAGALQVSCTLTSAARDASNSGELLAALTELGLAPQIIDGTVEGALTFAGVTSDFADQAVLVADNGGGSTELACGWGAQGCDPAALRTARPKAGLAYVESVDVGCRRVTERFLSAAGPDAPEALALAHDFARGLLEPACARTAAALASGMVGSSPDARSRVRDTEACAANQTTPRPVLVTCGGTVTSLVAIRDALVPYDSSRVHLARLSRDDVDQLEADLAALTVAERGKTPGLQPQRAAVIVGGAVCVAELLRGARATELVVSEHDLLYGLALAAAAEAVGSEPPVGWRPTLAKLA